MENETSGINIGDIWYIVKKYWIMMLAIVVAAGAIGAAYSVVRKQEYKAATKVMINADLGTGIAEKSDIQYSNLYAPTILEVMGSDIIMTRASEILGEDERVSGANFTAKQNNSDAWVATLTYQDENSEAAKEKLLAIIEAFNSFAAERKDDNSFKNFQGKIVLIVLSDAEYIVPSPVHSATKTTIIAAVAGIVVAVAAAFIIYFANDRITAVDRVEEITGKKNIVSVSTIRGKDKDALLKFNLEKLANALVFLHEGDSGNVYQVQSSTPHEGKTTVAVNLAIALGEMGKKVVVLECDFRRPNLHRALGLKRQVGMTDFFKDEGTLEQVTKQTAYANVSAVTCGGTVDNPAILFMSGKFDNIVKEARENYDFVLLDCPPVGGAADFISISRVADATILVVGCDKVSSRQLKSTVSDLEESGANVLGTVFNFAGRRKHKDYYYYSYKGKTRAENK